MEKSKHIIAIPPGETIRELLDDREMTQKEFAIRMSMSEKHISDLINGKAPLTPQVAIDLESVLGVEASFWNNLESQYKDKLIRIEREKEDEEEKRLLSKFEYRKLSKLDFVPNTNNKSEQLTNLRKFFEVSNLLNITNLKASGVAYRKMIAQSDIDYLAAAWIQKVRIQAREISVDVFSISKLKKAVPKIRSFCIQNPEDFLSELSGTLASCGVAMVILPHIAGSGLHGASFKSGKKIVLGLTVRGMYADKFWFTLFHELSHIINEDFKLDESSEEIEKRSDQYAMETLIDSQDYDRFVSHGIFNKKEILSFSESIKMDSGVVVGRLQKDNYIPFSQHNGLKKKYIIQ